MKRLALILCLVTVPGLALWVSGPRPVRGAEKSQQVRPPAAAHYVGSQACERCHADIYRRWKKTPMANVVRDPREHPDAIIPDLSTNHIAPFTRDQVAFVYGSVWKQRYFVKAGSSYVPLPVQWDIKTKEWLPYHVPNTGADWWAHLYPESNMERPTGPTCDGCHSVGFDVRTQRPVEWNVGCERCHGPGSEHAAHPSPANIVNPRKMDSFAENDTCIQCHSQGRSPGNPIGGKFYDWPVGIQAGLRLADFWDLENCTLGKTDFYYRPDCTANKNRMQGNDFAQSVMYRHEITCSSCHDVHGTANYAQLIKPASQICLNCHSPNGDNGPRGATLEAHTYHEAGSAGSECVACHMPAIESEGVPGAMVHAHTFRFISPAMTQKYGMPNACTACHKDKTDAWASAALRGWTNESAWRLE